MVDTPNDMISITLRALLREWQTQSEHKLKCDGVHGCTQPITHIDSKGYIYCTKHALRGRQLKLSELQTLLSGEPLKSYAPFADQPESAKRDRALDTWRKGN